MSFWLYLAAMALTTYLIRALPMVLMRRKISNRFLRSFLYYVPPACLTAMTFPAILTATDHILSGVAGLLAAVLAAFLRWKLPAAAALSCAAVLVCEMIYLL